MLFRSNNAQKVPYNNCALGYVNYGQIVTGPTTADQQSALTNLDQLPVHTGSGKTTEIPTTINGYANNGANFGSVTSVIGSSRMFTMSLHILF